VTNLDKRRLKSFLDVEVITEIKQQLSRKAAD
jgi:hypothetical protein